MKQILIIFMLLSFPLGVFSQNSETKPFKLFIVYQETGSIFNKPIDRSEDSIGIIKYRLKIPNQKKPSISFYVENQELKKRIKGGSNFFYNYTFLFNNLDYSEKIITRNQITNTKVTLDNILESDLEDFENILKNAEEVFILEEIDDKFYKMREVKVILR